ncbi:hypothetical protein AO366_0818 [Moraxella catarrhalis]|nr:hypothetical protein AO366_0818 [Moraxella catarrhalis]
MAGDDVVNKAEADKATVPVAVKVAPKDGETVTGVKVTINNKEYPAEKAANGDYVAQVTPADIKADQDKHADAKVTLSKDGKTGTVTDKEAYTVDTDAPTVKGNPTVDDAGTTLTVPFNEPLDAANPPTKESFTVKVDGKTVQPTKVTVDGDKVKLTLPNAIKQGDTVKVSYKDPSAADDAKAVQDKAGNDAASFTDTDVTNGSKVAPADTTPPKVKGTPAVDGAGTTLTVTFDEPLDAANPPAKENFKVKVGDKTVTPTNVTVEGDKVKLTLPEPAKQGDTVKVSYTDPTAANDPKAVQDKAGNDAASFTDTDVTNGSKVAPADTTPPKVKGTPAVDGAGTTLTVTFDEPLDAANPPAKENFKVKVGDKTVTPTNVTVEGDKVKLTLPEPAKQGDTVKVSYNDPSTANDPKAVQDKAGNDAASFTDTDVTNGSKVAPADTTPPKVKGTPAVDGAGTTLTVTFDEPLDAANPPAKENFKVKVGDKTVTPTNVTVEGDKVKLTLPEPAKQGDTVKVSYNDPSTANDPKAVQDKAGNDAASFTDTDVTNSSTVQDKPNSISSVTLVDNLTDETPKAQNYYPKNAGPYVGNVGNANTAKFDTAVSLKSGLTNDKTPTLNFTLDRAVATGESVEVIRHTMVNGHTARSEDVTKKVSLKQGSDKSYSLTDSLADTYGTDYKYTVRVKKGNKVVNEKSHAFRLDTTVESMEITKAEFDDKAKSAKISLKSRGNSEVGTTVTYKYMADGREMKGSITDRGNKGVYDLNLQGFDRKDTRGLTLETVDAAGNVTTQKVNFLRNLFSEYNTEKGVDVTKPSIDDANRVGAIMGAALAGRQATATGKDAIKATNGNDTLVVGLEKFGRFNELNGSVADEGGVAKPRTQNINFGAGDDFLLIRGNLQAFERESIIKMGAGNDKVQINGAITGLVANPKLQLDMGDGDDLLVVKKGVGSTIRSTLLFGNGNDSMFVDGDFNGRKENVNFGDGNNTLNIGQHLINNGAIAKSNITFGKDNDTLVISGNFDNKETTINMGNGDNFVQVGGGIRSGSIISGSGNDTYELGQIGWSGGLGHNSQSLNVKTGAGNDIVTIRGHAFRGGIYLEGGDDTLSLNTIQGSVSNTNTMVFDGGTGHDTLKLTGSGQSYNMDIIRNFETIDMASTQTKQTLNVTGDSLKKSTNSNKLYIKAGAEDTVNLGDGNASKANLKDGKLTWSKVNSAQQTIDETVYDAYNLATTDQWVYIQQGTTVV